MFFNSASGSGVGRTLSQQEVDSGQSRFKESISILMEISIMFISMISKEIERKDSNISKQRLSKEEK